MKTRIIGPTDILEAMFGADETVRLRVISDRKDEAFAEKLEVTTCRFSEIESVLAGHNKLNRGIFFLPNFGGHTDAEITRVNAQFVEMDNQSFEEQMKRIESFSLKPSFIIKTRKSYHVYWLVDRADVEKFRKIQKQLVKFFDGDPACTNLARCMRLPGFFHCKQEPVMVECIEFHPERRYTQEQMEEVLPVAEESRVVARPMEGTEEGLDVVLRTCLFLRHCAENAKTLPESDWYGMITNLANFKDGPAAIHKLSADYPTYSVAETDRKITHFRKSGTGPMRCSTIAEKGFKCPRLLDGTCKATAPAGMCTVPLEIGDIKALIKNLKVEHEDEIKNVEVALEFIERYMFNLDSAIAESIISTAIKTHFKFSTTTVRTLCSVARKVIREHQNATKLNKKKEDAGYLPWYRPTLAGPRFLPGALADYLAETCPVIYSAKQHYRYSDGVYNEIGIEEVRRIVRDKMISSETTKRQIEDAQEQWSILSFRPVPALNANPYMINVKNGTLDILNRELIPHDPKYLSTMQLNVNYDPEAECPRFIQYLHEVLEPDQIPLIQEMLGYMLVPITKAQKCFVLVGEPCAGKSVLLLVINDILLGKKNVSNISWQALNERFKPAELFGKLANAFADLPTKNIEDNGIFKALVGEDYLTVEKKGKDPFSFKSTARLIFSCNTIPKNHGDRSEGFYRRLIITRFNHAIPEDKRDVNLLDKLKTEADGIFVYALEGLYRLMENDYRFSVTDSNIAELQQYREESDSVLAFVHARCEIGADYEVGSTELYRAYEGFCKQSGLKYPVGPNVFTPQVVNACHGERSKDSTGRRRTIKGIRLAEEDW